jgi:5'-nucleotidase
MLPQKEWSDYRVLIVNDDGIHAEGIKVLEEFACKFFGEVFVVAPSSECSGMGRSISHRKTMNLHKIDNNHFAVDGTPTDCTIIALHHILKDRLPDIVLSGINHGDNTGNFVTYSGTFGGAFEAALEGFPAVALGQRRDKNGKPNLSALKEYLPKLFDYLRSVSWPEHIVMSVNFPDGDNFENKSPVMTSLRHRSVVRGLIIEDSSEGHEKLRIDLFQSNIDEGLGQDADVLAQGYISVTPMQTNWTCFQTLLAGEDKNS